MLRRCNCVIASAVVLSACGGGEPATPKASPTATPAAPAAARIVLREDDLPAREWKNLATDPEEVKSFEDLFRQCAISNGFETSEAASVSFLRERPKAAIAAVVEVYPDAATVEKLRYVYSPQVSPCLRRLFGAKSESQVKGVLDDDLGTVIRYRAPGGGYDIALAGKGRTAIWLMWRSAGRSHAPTVERAVRAMLARAV